MLKLIGQKDGKLLFGLIVGITFVKGVLAGNELTRPPTTETGKHLKVDGGSENVSDPKVVPFWFNEIPLEYAVKMGNVEAVRYRLAAGDNVTAFNRVGYAPVHIASSKGPLLPLLKYLVEVVGVDVNLKDRKGHKTPLHYAASSGKLDTLKYLITKGANITARDKTGSTPLHEAALVGAYLCVKTLAEEEGADLNAENDEGNTPLHVAASKHDTLTMSVLLRWGASVDWRKKGGVTPLHLLLRRCWSGLTSHSTATMSKRAVKDAISTLITSGANVNAKDDDEGTPLHLAVYGRCGLTVVRHLVELGADPSATNGDGNTPREECGCDIPLRDYLKNLENQPVNSTTTTIKLTQTPPTPVQSDSSLYDQHLTLAEAINAQDLDGVRRRVVAGGDNLTETLVKRFASLHIAAQVGYLPVFKYLVEEAGVDIEFRTVADETPLLIAAAKGSVDVVRYLVLERGANVSATDSGGRTPLHVAAQQIYLEPVKILIEKGAEVNALSNKDESPLRLAASTCFLPTVSYLVEHGGGASLELKSKDGHYCSINGKTPFHDASLCSYWDQFPTLKYLAGKGADVHTRANNGNTVLHHVANTGMSLRALKFLVESGVDVNAKNKYGSTPLHRLAKFLRRYDHSNAAVEKLRYLVQNGGADVGVRNNIGDTPFQLHKNWGSQEIRGLLTPTN